MQGGGGSTNIWKIPYVLQFLFLKASLTLTNVLNTSDNWDEARVKSNPKTQLPTKSNSQTKAPIMVGWELGLLFGGVWVQGYFLKEPGVLLKLC